MLRLYGFPVSNYYNVVKAALIEKKIPFEEVLVYPSGTGEHPCSSPTGKVPYLETAEGILSETQAILDYLEDVAPEIALYPADPFRRAKVRELTKIIELYLELPARRLYPRAFFGGTVGEETRVETRILLEQGMMALGRLARFGPWLAGREFTMADIAARMHLSVVARVGKAVYGEDLLGALEPLKAYMQRSRERRSFRQVHADYLTRLEDEGYKRMQAARAGGG